MPPEFSSLSPVFRDFLLTLHSDWSQQTKEQFEWREEKPGRRKANTGAVQGKRAGGSESGASLSFSGSVAVISVENLEISVTGIWVS